MKKILILCCVLVAAGCSSNPTMNFTPYEDIPPVSLSEKIPMELRSVSISVASNEEKTGEIILGTYGNIYGQAFRSTFKEALEEALVKSAVFRDHSTKTVSLTAKIMEFDQPGSGLNFPTSMTVDYSLIDRATGIAIFSERVTSSSEVPLGYAFLGSARALEAQNLSVQENILQLIAKLKSAKLR